MKNLWLLLLMVALPVLGQDQDEKEPEKKTVAVVDSLYREDQFYFSMAYNLVQSKPSDYSQRGFSPTFAFGFLRDMPVNKKRTIAFALGAGYSFTSIKHNLTVTKTAANETFFDVVSESSFDKNKLELHTVDVPLEIRWRTSTPESHKFWRIYTGFKASYVFASKAVYKAPGVNYKLANIDALNTFQYGAYINAGYNTWNLYAYYGLSPIFKKGTVAGKDLELNSLNLGLMFYIL
ncbi:porin family protein [Flavobacterium enshiense]|uniref:porin family protein n=1 Tax=Flavobacterium enshiense TaxID=1341165 RepID=UPI00345CE13E